MSSQQDGCVWGSMSSCVFVICFSLMALNEARGVYKCCTGSINLVQEKKKKSQPNPSCKIILVLNSHDLALSYISNNVESHSCFLCFYLF